MKGKSWIVWLCAIVTVLQLGAMGLTGGALEVQAATVDVAPSYGQTQYYDLANGAYYISGGFNGTITVNGEQVNSGTTLEEPGDYVIVNTINADGKEVTTTQYISLYQRADAHPDGAYDIKDLVAVKKHIQGIEISKAGQMAIEAYNDAYTNDTDKVAMWDVLLQNKTPVQAFPKVSASMRYSNGTSDVMPISGFLGPGYINADEYGTQTGALNEYRTDKIYKLVADAGINLIMATVNKTAEGELIEPIVREELRLAEKYGMGMYVQPSYVEAQPELLDQYIKELNVYDSFMGITLEDEPNTSYYYAGKSFNSDKTYDKSKALAQAINKYANLTGYTNLLPYWTSMGTEEEYEQYLNEYFTQYTDPVTGKGPKQLSFDYYVFAEKDTDRNPTEYFTTLRIAKKVADEHGVPFWSVVQAGDEVTGNMIRYTQDKSLYMTEGKTLWNVNTSLAYGAKGITYYPLVQPWEYSWRKTYSWSGSPRADDYNYDRNGVIGADGEATPHYEYVKKANQQIQAVDNVLMNATHKGILAAGSNVTSHTGGSTVDTAALKLKALASANTTAGAMAGCFDYLGKDAYYVVNYDYTNAQNVTLTFDADYALSVTINGQTSLINTADKKCTLSLSAGEAALVLVNGVQEEVTGAQAVIDAINAIPEGAEMPKYYTTVLTTQTAYDRLDKFSKQSIDAALTEKLTNLVKLTSGYVPIYEKALQAGGNTGSQTVNEVYGNVTVLEASGATAFTSDLTTIPADYSHMVFYVYNPAEQVNATYGSVEVSLAAQSWTMVEVPADQVNNDLTFETAVSGTWHVTRFYGKNDTDMVAQVERAIAKLPEASAISMADAQAVEAVRVMYNGLDDAQKETVENYEKLTACENRLLVLPVEALIDKLPAADEITIKDLLALDQAKKAYSALDASLHSAVPAAKVEKLNACAAAAEGSAVVLSPNDATVSDPTGAGVYTTGTAADEDYGTVFTMNFTADTKTGFQINGDLTGYTNRYFYIYNPTGAVVQAWMYYLNPGWKELPLTTGENPNLLTMQPGWNKVTLPDSSEIAMTGGVLGAFVGTAITGEWRISAVYSSTAESADKMEAAQVESLLKKLPAANALGGSDRDDVTAANAAYNELSDAARAYISEDSKNKLSGCLEKLSQWDAWEARIVYGTADNTLVGSGDVTHNVDDNTFGTVMMLSKNSDGVASYKIPGSAMTGVSAVEFYINNPTDGELTGYYTADWTNNVTFTLQPGWNRIHIQDGAEEWQKFVSGKKEIYVYLDNKTITWPVSALFKAEAEDPEGAVIESINEKIALLPAANALKLSDKEAVSTIVTAYGTLSEAGKARVENYTLVEQCLAKIAQWDAYDAKTVISITDSTTGVIATEGTVVDDNTYGKVISIPNGRDMIVLQPNAANAAYKASEGIEFYVYNPTGSALTFGTQDNSANWESFGNYTAQPGWTKFQVLERTNTAGGEIIGSGLQLYFLGTMNGDGWKVTSVYAMTEADINAAKADQVDKLIEALPDAGAVVIENKDQIVAARAAYTALTSAQQALVKAENLTKLTACEAKIAELDTPADNVTPVNELIAALPAADQLTVANKQAVTDAKAAYDALTSDEQAQVVGVDKLNACVAKVDFWNTLEAKKIADVAKFGQVTKTAADDNIFGTVSKFTGANNYFTLASLGESITCDSAIFYVYNPTAEDLYLELTNDNWSHTAFMKLYAGRWTAVEIIDGSLQNGTKGNFFTEAKTVTTWFYVKNAAGAVVNLTNADWKFTSVYGMSKATDYNQNNIFDSANVYGENRKVVFDVGDGINGVFTNGQAVANDAFGTVYEFSTCDKGTIFVSKARKTEEFRSCDNVVFYIYNPTDAVVEGSLDWCSYFSLKPKQWNRVVITNRSEAEPLVAKDDNLWIVLPTVSEGANGEKWMITSFYGTVPVVTDTPVDNVTPVNELIAALPAADQLLLANKQAVTDAEAAYEALTSDEQAQVVGVDKLNACVAKVTYWNALAEKVIIDASNTGISTNLNDWAGTACTPGVDDNTFGKVMSVPVGTTILAIEGNKKAEAWDACEAIGFYIYNPTNAEVTGKYYYAWSATSDETFTLAAGEWTYIELKDHEGVADKAYISTDATMYIDLNCAVEGWKISGFYSAPLPEMPGVEAQGTVLKDATSAGQIYVYNTVTGDSIGANVTIGTDAEHGSVFQVNYTGSHSANVIGLQFTPLDMTGYETVEFYVYNPGSSAVNVRVQDRGDWVERTTQSAAAGEWTKVTVNVADYTGVDVLVYIDGVANTQYKISSVVGY